MVPRLYELGAAVPRGCLDEIWGIPLVPLRSSGRSLADRALKRAADLAAALVLLAAAAPVLLAMAAVTRLAGLPAAELAGEVGGSRAALTGIAGTPIRGFAYPYGSIDAPARQAVRTAGYDYACAVETATPDLSLAALPRIYVGQRDNPGRLAAKRLLYRGYIAVKGRRG